MLKSGRLDQAIKSFNAHLALDPNDVDALYNRGWAALLKGDYKSADEDMVRVLDLAPAYSSALIARGLCLLIDGNPGEALGYIRQALVSDGGHLREGSETQSCRQAVELDGGDRQPHGQ